VALVSATLPGLRRVMARISSLHGTAVTAGLQGTPQTTEAGDASPGELVEIGTVHEYGSSDGFIPARPWLSTAARTHGSRWQRGMAFALRAKARGDDAQAAQALALLGLTMVGDIQATIRRGPWAPLSPATLGRRVKGPRASKPRPLIDTGQMIQSVRAQVEAPGLPPVVVG
jgi:hypothetical protein